MPKGEQYQIGAYVTPVHSKKIREIRDILRFRDIFIPFLVEANGRSGG